LHFSSYCARKFAFFTKQILVVRLPKTGTVVLTSDAVYLKEQGWARVAIAFFLLSGFVP
jgi:hypothetical protein